MSEKSSRVDDPYFIKELNTRVNLKPNQFKNLDKNIYDNLKNKIEGRNQSCGYVNPDSCVIVKRSNGYFRGNHLTGEMTFDINYIAEVCYPMKGDIIVSNIADINEGGLIAINGPIVMFAPKDYQNNYSFFEKGINLGSKIKFQVIDSKSQLYDNTIDTIVEIIEILDNNAYIENDLNKIRLKNLNSDELSLEVKNIANLNQSLFGFENNLDLILNKYRNNDVDNRIKSFVNKYELVNPNINYHEKIFVKNINTDNNTFFEILELNYYYDLIQQNNNQESFLVFNDNDNSIIKSIMYLRDREGNTDKYISQIEPNSKFIKHNNISTVKHKFGSDNSFSNTEYKINTILYNSNELSNKEYDMLSLLKYCFNYLMENGNLVVKTNFIYNSFTYKIVSYLSFFFNECHYVRPDCCKDYEGTCYLVFKYFKNSSKKDEKRHDELLKNKNFNDFKNIPIDKHNLKDILLFNNKNGKQIYYKTLTKIDNFVHNNPTEENIQKQIDIQKLDAQKWYSKFLNN